MSESPYKSCNLCPHSCGVDRLSGETGRCGETAQLRICVTVLHNGEEPPLTGDNGSGTIFVSGCNLGCIFCQNHQISQGVGSGEWGVGRSTHSARVPIVDPHSLLPTPHSPHNTLGRVVSTEEFVEICKKLRDKGAENINIVTGSHVIPAIVEGITAAKNAGVQLPLLWNTSAYENPQALELLKDHVDIYLPDLKTLDREIAGNFYGASDYPQIAAAAILKMVDMVNQKSDFIEMANYEMERNERVIIRHLILPGYLESTRSVLCWFAENLQGRAKLSLMTQYTPIPGRPGMLALRKMPGRFLHESEYETVMLWLQEFGINDGYCQELVTGSDWLPDFKRQNPFSSKLSVPVWHFMT